MSSKPHFVLIHGACLGAWCWYKVATTLKFSGCKVTALDLAAAGVNPKKVTEIGKMSDYVEPLFSFMDALPPEEKVILVGHSMGGVAISMALEKFPEKICVAVFVTALMPGPDLTLEALTEEYSRRLDPSYNDDVTYTYDDGPENPPTSLLIGPKYMAAKLYQLSPPEDLSLASYLVRPIRLYPDHGTWGEKIILTKEKFGTVRRVFIVCDQDNQVKEDMQKWMIENNPPDEVLVVPGSDHMVMCSKFIELCRRLEMVAQKYFKPTMYEDQKFKQ